MKTRQEIIFICMAVLLVASSYLLLSKWVTSTAKDKMEVLHKQKDSLVQDNYRLASERKFAQSEIRQYQIEIAKFNKKDSILVSKILSLNQKITNIKTQYEQIGKNVAAFNADSIVSYFSKIR
jgi:predicted nuclease with TOPRIM domain